MLAGSTRRHDSVSPQRFPTLHESCACDQARPGTTTFATCERSESVSPDNGWPVTPGSGKRPTGYSSSIATVRNQHSRLRSRLVVSVGSIRCLSFSSIDLFSAVESGFRQDRRSQSANAVQSAWVNGQAGIPVPLVGRDERAHRQGQPPRRFGFCRTPSLRWPDRKSSTPLSSCSVWARSTRTHP